MIVPIKHSSSIIILMIFIATGITIIILPSVHGSAVQRDRFGISEVYPSAVNDNEWYSLWDDGHVRTIGSGQRDPYDQNFEVTGNMRTTDSSNKDANNLHTDGSSQGL